VGVDPATGAAASERTISMDRRTALRHALWALLWASLASASPAQAQSWPEQPIRLVVPWPAGGLVDVTARQLSTRLEKALGQPVIVENRLGAGGAIGADAVAKAQPNGYTLVFTTSALTISSALKKDLPFDVLRDFEPLAAVGHAPSVLVVSQGARATSVKELVAQARSQPGKLSYASAGIGSPAHMTGEMFKSREKIFVVHVPYTGAPAAMNDQLAGRIDFQFANAAVALPQIQANKVKALAVTGARRFAALPDVPTMIEAGLPDFEADQWLGLLAPRGIPPAAAERLDREVQKILVDDDFRAALAKAGVASAPPGNAQAFASYLRQDLAKWRAVIQAQNIKAE
jgi:tripartite-type tricarboxylate transporter receptor subunit TctC